MKKKKANINKKVRKIVNKTLHDLLHPKVQIVSTSNGVPTYASSASAGMDIKADLWEIKEQFLVNAEVVRNEVISDEEDKKYSTIESIIVHPGGHCLVPTGIYTAFDDLYEMQVRPRSGNALKYRVTITNSPGTIEGDYKDEWGIIIDNEGSEDFVIKQGDRIAQVVMALICRPTFEVVESRDQLTGPDRGGGFGSSKDLSNTKIH